MSAIPILPTRKIGGEAVTAIGYGAMGVSNSYGYAVGTDEDSLRVLDAIYERGCTFWDTADVYVNSEAVIGKWFTKTGKRKEIFLATKCGFVMREGQMIDGSPAHVKEAIDKSLQLLQTDYVDLYYLHRADAKTPIEVTVTAMAELVKAGKVKHLGLSEVSASTLRRAHAIHPIAAVQVEYSPFTLDIEDPQIALLKTARELGVAIVAYSPLGRGLLTGKYKSTADFEENDWRKTIARYSDENFPNLLKITEHLEVIGARHGASSGQVALAWLLAQGDDIIPIPGTNKPKYMDDNLGALEVKLTSEEIAEVRTLAEKADHASGGDRYPPGMNELLFVETPAWTK